MAFDTPEGRWSGVGPYYAMFPTLFADHVIEKYSDVGDCVLDPFAGRGTAVFSAATRNRIGVGVEINPVGWVYGKTKIRPARQIDVETRLNEIAGLSGQYLQESSVRTEFFRWCFSTEIFSFLLSARSNLNWRRANADRTLMSLLLVYLHGKYGQALSNQMRQTKAMSPQYSVRWWKQMKSRPPRISPYDFMLDRIKWRYKVGYPATSASHVYLGQAERVLPTLKKAELPGRGFKLLFTSPPYSGVTNYYYDQWLRLWLLGGPPVASSPKDAVKGRFGDRAAYYDLLADVFGKCAALMRKDGVIYIRTDTRRFTLTTTRDVLRDCFPHKHMSHVKRPLSRPSQTHLFGDHNPKDGEVDIILK